MLVLPLLEEQVRVQVVLVEEAVVPCCCRQIQSVSVILGFSLLMEAMVVMVPMGRKAELVLECTMVEMAGGEVAAGPSRFSTPVMLCPTVELFVHKEVQVVQEANPMVLVMQVIPVVPEV